MNSPTSPPPILEFKSISKVFQRPPGSALGPCIASQNISFAVRPATIHALVGENGAGKSTLMKMLFGLYEPTDGEIFFNGQAVRINSPQVARSLGLGMVQQHFMLADSVTALDHLFLEDTAKTNLWGALRPLSRSEYLKRAQAISEKFQLPIPWDEKVENLSVGYQQRLELLKLLFLESKILIFDEPTALLSPQEVDRFLEHLRLLKEKGHTILMITHKLNEVFAVCDDVTVLRAGTVVFSGNLQTQTKESVARLMVGSSWQGDSDFELRKVHEKKQPCLRVTDLCVEDFAGRKKLNHLSFELQAGEILGIAGVEGQGQSELMSTLLSQVRSSARLQNYRISGQIHFVAANSELVGKKSADVPKANFNIGFVGEDRLSQSVVEELSLCENLLLGKEAEFEVFRWIPWSELAEKAAPILREMEVQPADPKSPMKSLSGGNQQKAVMARELHFRPKILLIAQPTRGVDFASSQIIHKAILAARDEGAAILLVTSDIHELMLLSDRLFVLSQGRIAGEMQRGHFDLARIGALMGGLT